MPTIPFLRRLPRLLIAACLDLASQAEAQTPPTISDVLNRSTLESTPTSSIAITIGDAETPATSLVLSAASSNATLVPNSPANLSLAGTGTARTLVITPASGESGTTTITLTVTDGSSMTATDTFVLTVNPLYSLPAETIPDQMMSADSSITLNYQMGSGTWSPVVTSTNTTLFRSIGTGSGDDLRLQGTGTNRTLRIRPAPGLYGESFVTITITGAAGGPTASTFRVTVNPRAVADNVLGVAGRTSTLDVLRNDTLPQAGSSVIMQSFTQPANGTIVAGTIPGTLHYTPATGFTGSDAFTYTTQYNQGPPVTATVFVTAGDYLPVDAVHTDLRVNYVNGAWTHEVHADLAFGTPNQGGSANPTILDYDEAMLMVNAASIITLPGSLDPIQFSFLGAAPGQNIWTLPQVQKAGVLWPGVNSESIAPGTFATYTPAGDPRASTSAAWVRMEMTGFRIPSGAVFSMYQSGATPIVFWDSIDGVNSPSETAHGNNVSDTFWINTGTHSHMNWTFTHPGRYEIDFRAKAMVDQSGTLVEVTGPVTTLHFLVFNSPAAPLSGPMTERPPVALNDTTTVTEDSGANLIPVLANDRSDPDPLEQLAVTAVANGASGTTAITGGGTAVTYTPLANFSGTDSFTYTVTDEHGGTATATVTVNVTAQDDLAAWRQTHFGTTSGTGDAAHTADPEDDGFVNLKEWAFGTHPSRGEQPAITTSGPTLLARGTPVVIPGPQVLFTRRRFHATEGLAYTVEFSPDLSFWESSAASPAILAHDGEYEACTVPFPPLVDGRPARFVRVRITSSR